jgi:hypothetical protein
MAASIGVVRGWGMRIIDRQHRRAHNLPQMTKNDHENNDKDPSKIQVHMAPGGGFFFPPEGHNSHLRENLIMCQKTI